ncbi:TSL-kinase interacting protein 1 isoform X2 [Humulus lupulus]|uniref:TSL-kinase interacting protein 1 isoform X2 n=1 Tax=Humulus lupulus TaxID=3486 RepID=UPI002B40E20B|nr:TSL-kinase interacting protein 1 isoform X2 [Humulus lupulus]
MKVATEKSKKATNVPRESRSSISKTGTSKFRKTGGRDSKRTAECSSVKQDEHSLRSCTAEGLSVKRLDETKGTLKDLSAPNLCQGKTFLPDLKIKLQLFPIDEVTRRGLEHDGYHPYLELILRGRKKISSVLEHLNKKWGSSKIAIGEPVLFPYDVHGSLSGCRRWTMKDSDIKAGEIYAFIGSPANFRLRYGWFSTSDSKTSDELPAPSTPDVKKADTEEIQVVVSSEDIKLINRTDSKPGNFTAQWDDITNISIGGLLSEASLQGKFGSLEAKLTEKSTGLQPVQTDYCPRSFASWDDSLTNISIGGLLSEVSLQGKFSNNAAKAIGSNADLQPTQMISDSLDAFISAQRICPQGPRPPAHDSHSSILDAEETCHAFPVQKFSSSKRVSALSGGSSGGCSQEAGSRSFRFPKIDETNVQVEVPKDHAYEESQTDVLVSSQKYIDENSLGFAGINWSESLGPFDLGLPASRNLFNGEKDGINGFGK